MNGMRRFLGGGGSGNTTPTTQEPVTPLSAQPLTAPLFITGKPSWPPSDSPPTTPSPAESPKMATAALFLRKDKTRPSLVSSDDEGVFSSNGTSSPRSSNGILNGSPVAGPSSPRQIPLPHRVSQLSRKSVAEWKRSSGMLNGIKDDLLMSLLATEAVVDSRGYEILSAEEVEELKKEHQVLSSRLVAMQKKLSLETKIRDAALSLYKANASYKAVSKQTSDQLETANRKVDNAQREYWRVSERANEIHKRLLEHRAGVLSHSMKSMERKFGVSTPDVDLSGYNNPLRSSQILSPTGSTASTRSASRPRFDGAHFFAGHSEAVVPTTPKPPPSPMEFASIEDKLKAATAALEAANAKQAEMARELSLLKLEKEQVEMTLGMELETARDTITSLERESGTSEALEARLREVDSERTEWMRDRSELEERRKEVDTLERRLELLEEQSGETSKMQSIFAKEREAHREELERKTREVEDVKMMWESDRVAWELEKATLEGELTANATKLKQEAEGAADAAKTQLDTCFASLRDLVQNHGILLVSREPSIQSLILSIDNHIDSLNVKLEASQNSQKEWAALRLKLEEDVRAGLDKRESLYGELERARKERDDAKAEARDLEGNLKEQYLANMTASRTSLSQIPIEYTGDASKIVSILQPLWAILPSPEARAGKMGTRFRAGSPTASPVTTRGGSSLSEMDVRSLKTLYDPKSAHASSVGGPFTVEAFAERVQALIVDDRALIERLIRFAQAHDLLKKNAERAQKLAQESNAALETYQKQVKLLEGRNLSMVSKQAALQDEIQSLQEAVDRITAEKLEVETLAAEQAETCAQLTDANNKLSARALALAEEAATAQGSTRRQTDARLAELNGALEKAKGEIESMRLSQQTQQMAMMEELNSIQTENDNLRAQLRAKK
ncbi:hypothetical protein ABKN59_001391 [Abortiporus biennis]